MAQDFYADIARPQRDLVPYGTVRRGKFRARGLARLALSAKRPSPYIDLARPILLIRQANVVGRMAKSSAAPPGPWTLQFVWSRAASMFSRSRRFISASGTTVVDAVAAVAAVLACIAFNEVAKHPGRIKPGILKRRRHRYPPMQRPRNQLRAELVKK